MSLIGEVKRRQVKAAQAMLPAMAIRPTVEARVSDLVAEMVRKKQIRPEEAEEVSQSLLEQADPEIRKQESRAFRGAAAETAAAPATFLGAAGTAGVMAAFPWLLSRGSYLWGKKPKKPMSLKESFKFGFLPSFIPLSMAFETIPHLLAPLSDPMRRRGERGYWRSAAESFRGAQEGLAERGAEARERYGMLGIPLQMFHGIMNPLASLGYLGRQIGGVFQRPDIEEWAREAAERRRALLEAQP